MWFETVKIKTLFPQKNNRESKVIDIFNTPSSHIFLKDQEA